MEEPHEQTVILTSTRMARLGDCHNPHGSAGRLSQPAQLVQRSGPRREIKFIYTLQRSKRNLKFA